MKTENTKLLDEGADAYNKVLNAYFFAKIYAIVVSVILFILAGCLMYQCEKVKSKDVIIKNRNEAIDGYKSNLINPNQYVNDKKTTN